MSKGSGYLLYEIVDTMYDYCFPILDKIGFKLDSIEDELFEGESDDLVRDISNIKQEIINYRKIVKPQRPTLRLLERSNQRYAPQDLEIYFDDIVDKSERIWDLLENYKEVAEALEATNESVITHKLNDIIRAPDDPVGRAAAADPDHERLRDEHRDAAVRPRRRALVPLPAGADGGHRGRADRLVPPQAVAVGGPGAADGGPDIMWSPWRMAYISAEHEHDHDGAACVFCDLPARGDDERTYILYRGARAFVIMNLYPYNNGHLMMVPYAHVDSLAALDEATLTELMGLAQRSQAVLAGPDAAPGLQPRHQPGPRGRRGDRRPRPHAPACRAGWATRTSCRPSETCA